MRVIVIGKKDFGEKLAKRIPESTFLEIEDRVFPDGEICPRLLIKEDNELKNTHVIIAMQLKLNQSINHYLVSLLLTIHNVKRLEAEIITCVMPYHIYSRQDRESRETATGEQGLRLVLQRAFVPRPIGGVGDGETEYVQRLR